MKIRAQGRDSIHQSRTRIYGKKLEEMVQNGENLDNKLEILRNYQIISLNLKT